MNDAEVRRITGVITEMVLVSTGPDRLFPIDDVGYLVEAVLDEENRIQVENTATIRARSYDAGYDACLNDVGGDKPSRVEVFQSIMETTRWLTNADGTGPMLGSDVAAGIVREMPAGAFRTSCDPSCNPAMNVYCTPACERRDRRRK